VEVPVLDPLEALAEGALDAALHGVRLVRRHPPLPVHVRVAPRQPPLPLRLAAPAVHVLRPRAELVLVRVRRHGTAPARAVGVGPEVRASSCTNAAAAAVVGLDLRAPGARVRLGPVHDWLCCRGRQAAEQRCTLGRKLKQSSQRWFGTREENCLCFFGLVVEENVGRLE
jgi:hypothetical protein